ncbi:MAG: P-loop NTPase [Chloroflexota bacterium]|nr:P-loop NTPase [Chloroflexota bacterium]
MEHKKALTGRRIGVFGKGGSGKSTALVLLAMALRDSGYEVCVVDADSTNVGLHQALGMETAPTQLLDYFGGVVFSGGSVTCPVDDPTPLPGADISLDQLPDRHYSQNDGGILLLTAGKIGDQGPGAGCDGPVSKIARDLRIHQNGETPVTLVDFKAGFEDSARGAVTGLDWALVVVDPTTAAIQMAANMRDMVNQIKAGGLPATKHLETPDLVEWANRIFREATIKGVLVILNRVRDEEMEGYMREKLAEQGIEAIGVIHEDPAIAMSWLKGMPMEAANAKSDVERIVEKLERAEEKSLG